MKRGTKLFLTDPEGKTIGPFAWTLVREWFAFSFLTVDSRILVNGEEAWRKLSEFPDLYTFSKSFSDPSGSVSYYKSTDRYQVPSTPTQKAYLRHLGCPFSPDTLDKHLANHIIGKIEGQLPERIDPTAQAQIEQEWEKDWRNDPASERQKDYLRSIGVPIESEMTKGRAAAAIAPPSTGQLRRLRFYGIALPRNLDSSDASELIDSHVRTHPESEEQYQVWKLTQTGNT